MLKKTEADADKTLDTAEAAGEDRQRRLRHVDQQRALSRGDRDQRRHRRGDQGPLTPRRTGDARGRSALGRPQVSAGPQVQVIVPASPRAAARPGHPSSRPRGPRTGASRRPASTRSPIVEASDAASATSSAPSSTPPTSSHRSTLSLRATFPSRQRSPTVTETATNARWSTSGGAPSIGGSRSRRRLLLPLTWSSWASVHSQNPSSVPSVDDGLLHRHLDPALGDEEIGP